jgi:tetratricopeptide (TPR) repeat protein
MIFHQGKTLRQAPAFWVTVMASLAQLVILISLVLPSRASDTELESAIRLFDEGDYDAARSVLIRIKGAGTEDSEIAYYLGRVSLIDNDWETACDYLKTAIEKDEKRSVYHYWLAVALARQIPYSNFFGRMRISMRLLNELNRAVDLDPSNLEARLFRLRIFARSFGKAPISRKDILGDAEAIAEIDSALGYLASADYYHLVENDDSVAGAHFERAAELEPADSRIMVALAGFYWDAGRREDAIDVLDASWNEHPENLWIGYELGTRLILAGKDLGRARVILEECLNLKSESGMPTKAMVHWTLGLAHHVVGESDSAESHWAKAHALDQDFDRFLENSPQLEELRSLLNDH